ncbi:MAG: hypothetical protein GEV11_00750 [Streptosporangiales bacterium]|nr:hypothetical protein [Streptosporangiales bacterium]
MAYGTKPARAATFALAGVLLMGGLTGCGSLGGLFGGDKAAEGQAEGGSDSGSGESGDVQSSTADTKNVIGKATFDAPVADGAKVEIAVHQLKVNGKLAELVFSVTPRVPAGGLDDEEVSPYDLNGSHGFDVTLIDPVNLKRYMVVKDSSGQELKPDDVFTKIRNNQQLVMRYTFAAPQAGVDKVDVQINNWGSFRDVPVQR